MDVEPVIDLLEFAPRLVTEQAPGLQRQRITALQLHHLIAGCGLKSLVIIKALLRFPVESHQITEVDGIGGVERLGSHLLEVSDQHPKLGAPVAHMIQAQHRMAAELQHPRQRVANDCGAQMAHVHLLGNVGAREVDHYRSRVLHRRDPEPVIP